MFWLEDLMGAVCSAIVDYFSRRFAKADAMVEDAFEQELRLAHARDLDDWDEAFHLATGKWPPWYRQDYRAPGQGGIVRGTFDQLLQPGLRNAFSYIEYKTGILDQQLGQMHQCATHEEFMAQQMSQQQLLAQMGMAQAQQRQMTPLEQLQNQMGLGQLGALNGLGDPGILNLLGYGSQKGRKSGPE